IKALCIRRQRRSKQLRIAGLDPATRDKNPALTTFELYAVLLAGLIDYAAAPVVRRRAFANELYAIGVGVVYFVLAVSREAAGNHLHQRLGFNTHGAAAIMAGSPLRDIQMMRAPIGHLPTR